MSLLVQVPTLSSENLPSVTIYTEDFPPYNFVGPSGELEGISSDIVRQVMAEANMDYEFRLLPWPRAYREAELDKHGLIFSLARTVAREREFDWLVYLSKPEFYLYALKSDQRTVTSKAIQLGNFTAICEETDASCSMLREIGFPEVNFLKIPEGSLSEITMIVYGRADFYIGDRNSHKYRLAKMGLLEDATKPVFKLASGMGFYLSAGVHVEQTLRDKIRAAYQRLLEVGTLQPEQ